MLNMKKIAQMGAIILCGLMLTACGTKTSKSSAKQEVSGPMTKVGQYQRAGEDYPQATLLAIKHYNKTFNVDGATIKITTGKLIQMDATTKKQREDYESNFGERLGENGMGIITPRGEQLTINNGAMDFGIEDNVQPEAKKSNYIQALVKKSDKDKMNKFKIVSPTFYDANGDGITEEQTTLALTK